MKNSNKKTISIGFLTILLCALARLIPHPPNFTPVIASAVLGGFVMKDLKWALAVPLLIMFFSDLFLGLHSFIPVTYSALAICSLISWKFSKGSVLRTIGLSTVSALVFFIISNFGVWALSGMYPKNIAGLTSCYVAAIPFFERTLLSTMLYVTAGCSLFEFAKRCAVPQGNRPLPFSKPPRT